MANFQVYEQFYLSKINKVENKFFFIDLSSKRPTPKGDIPVRTLKDITACFIKDFTNLINFRLEKGIFRVELKIADVIFQKKNKKNKSLHKENYGPLTNLPHLSKVYERILYYKIIDKFMGPMHSPCLGNFNINRNSQYSF